MAVAVAGLGRLTWMPSSSRLMHQYAHLHVAQCILKHPGDAGGVRLLVICRGGEGETGAVRSWEDVCALLTRTPPPRIPPPFPLLLL